MLTENLSTRRVALSALARNNSVNVGLAPATRRTKFNWLGDSELAYTLIKSGAADRQSRKYFVDLE